MSHLGTQFNNTNCSNLKRSLIMKSSVHSSASNTYLDSQHSTSLRNILAISLFAGIAQVLLFQILPVSIYIGLFAVSLYLLFGKNNVSRKLQGIDSHQFAKDTQDVEQRIKNRIRYLTSKELMKKHQKSNASNNSGRAMDANLENKNISLVCNILEFPKK